MTTYKKPPQTQSRLLLNSSISKCFIKIFILKNFANFRENQICRGVQPLTLLKKETLTKVYSCKFTKFVRTASLATASEWAGYHFNCYSGNLFSR